MNFAHVFFVLLLGIFIGSFATASDQSVTPAENMPEIQLEQVQVTEEPTEIEEAEEEVTENNEYVTYAENDDYYEAGADGHQITLINNRSAKDITYEELMDFLINDTTDLIPYDSESYVCSDYAETVHNNAEKAGISAAWVGIGFEEDNSGHALNAFKTTDFGTVYIDCTNGDAYCESWDSELDTLEVGTEYTPRMLFVDDFDVNPMGTVDEIVIYW